MNLHRRDLRCGFLFRLRRTEHKVPRILRPSGTRVGGGHRLLRLGWPICHH